MDKSRNSKNSDELEGLKNTDKEKGGEADLRILLVHQVVMDKSLEFEEL
jgi:hypothetical protein